MACQEFEALFLEYMLSTMRKAVPKSDLLGNSQEEEMYTSLFDQELCVKLSQQKGLGLGDLLYNQLQAGLTSDGEEKEACPAKGDSEKLMSGAHPK
jgi:flagellar protein FlgJ